MNDIDMPLAEIGKINREILRELIHELGEFTAEQLIKAFRERLTERYGPEWPMYLRGLWVVPKVLQLWVDTGALLDWNGRYEVPYRKKNI